MLLKTQWTKEVRDLSGLVRMVLSFLIFFFTDDMVLFGASTGQQINSMMECLDKFYTASGAKVSVSKTDLFF